jgi:2-dehydropantoate 2-reductase
MKIVVVGGAGAMGGAYASRLSAAGHDVSILDVSEAAIEAINRDGLIVSNPQGIEETFRIPVTNDARTIGHSDVAIVFTKSQHTASAAKLMEAAVSPHTTIVSLQNGWGNEDTLAETYDPDQIVAGVTYHSALVKGPGRIAHMLDVGPTYLGPYVDGYSLAAAERVAEALNAGGIRTTVTPTAKTEVWKKLVLNSAVLAVSGLTRLKTGDVGNHEELMLIADQLTRESVAVGQAKGFDVDLDERIAAIRNVWALGGQNKTSMLQDIEARRFTEVEAVNGAILREAAKLDLEAPLNRMMAALIHGLEASWSAE